MAKITFQYGLEFLGHLDQPDGTVIATRCHTINYLPVFPAGTFRLPSGRSEHFSAKSLFAAFFKPWGFVCACLLTVYTFFWNSWRYHPNLSLLSPVVGLLFT